MSHIIGKDFWIVYVVFGTRTYSLYLFVYKRHIGLGVVSLCGVHFYDFVFVAKTRRTTGMVGYIHINFGNNASHASLILSPTHYTNQPSDSHRLTKSCKNSLFITHAKNTL